MRLRTFRNKRLTGYCRFLGILEPAETVTLVLAFVVALTTRRENDEEEEKEEEEDETVLCVRVVVVVLCTSLAYTQRMMRPCHITYIVSPLRCLDADDFSHWSFLGCEIGPDCALCVGVCVCVCVFFPLPLGFCGRGGRGGSGIDDIGGSFCGGRGTGCLRRCVQYLLGVLLWRRPCHRNPRTFFFLLLLFPLFCLLFAVVSRYWNSVVCLISVL